MSLVLADRVQQTGTANTTVSFTLSGAVTGFQSFSVIGNGNTTYYSATDSTGNWEVGIGTYSTSGPTLTRTTILSSSNAGSAVTFSGTVNVFVTYPSEEAVVLGGTPTFSTVTTNASTTAASNVGPLNYGTLNFSDTGIVLSSQTSVNSYFQNVIQNTSNGTQASAEFIAYNDQGTATTNYATVGINSSGYSGTGSINAPGYGYFLTASTDLVLGTIGANGIHFTTNSAAADAMTISSSNVVSIVKDALINGLTVGKGFGSTLTNSVFGISALSANTTGTYNNAFGYQSLQNTTTGNLNTAFGGLSLKTNTTGNYNTALGYTTLYANTSGAANVAVGGGDGATYGAALGANTTGSNNTAVGNGTLQANTTASNNTAVGYQAGYSNTTGDILTAVGQLALYANTTGTANSAFGRASLYSNTSGGYNTALGVQSLNSNTTASNNTAVGYQAGYSQTTFGANTFIGYQAGYTQNNTSSYTYNTFVGYQAGYATTTAVKCTILGGYNGNQGGLDIRTSSNYIVLSDGDGNPRGVFDNSGNFAVNGAINSTSGTTASLGSSGTATVLNTTNLSHWMLTANGNGNTTQFAQVMIYTNAVGGVTVTSLVSVGITISASGLNTVIVTNGVTTQTIGYAAIRIK